MFTYDDALNVLHVDAGTNDELIIALVAALPDYIETTTGLSAEHQETEPLAHTVAGLLVTQWYYADHADDQSLTRTINALLKALSVRARSYAE